MNIHHWGRGLRVVLAAAASSAVLAACGGTGAPVGSTGAEPSEPVAADMEAQVDAALEEGGSITYWTWTNAEPQVAAFEEAYPNVDVELVNVGTGNEHYTQLQNAISAGSGAPDVAQIEFHAIPQFALAGHLVDLRQYGFEAFADDYVPSAWESAHAGTEALYGLPQGGGPMALFYNQRVFDEHGIEVPTTWDEYLAAARALKEADPSIYITGDTGDANFLMGMIWQAGGRPFSVDGTEITIDLQDEGTLRWTSIWNQLLEEDHLAPFPHWTEEWFRALGDGTIATLPFGGWMGGVFAGFEDGVGDWRVAPMPTYEGGDPVSSEHGGSHESVLEQSENPALAAAFLRWLNHEEGNQVYAELGGLPATIADLEDPEFLSAEWEYFGGQQINEVIVDAAKTVGEGWQFLPYQSYANTILGDTVGQAYLNKTDLNDGLQAWQEALVEYGNQQGFQVNGG